MVAPKRTYRSQLAKETNVRPIPLAQHIVDRLRRPMDGNRLGYRRRSHGEHPLVQKSHQISSDHWRATPSRSVPSGWLRLPASLDRKSTRLNSSHLGISDAVF